MSPGSERFFAAVSWLGEREAIAVASRAGAGWLLRHSLLLGAWIHGLVGTAALFALGLSMLPPIIVVLVLRSAGLAPAKRNVEERV